MFYGFTPRAAELPASSFHSFEGGGPRVVVSTAAFHARVRGSVPGFGGLKETKLFLPHPDSFHFIHSKLELLTQFQMTKNT